MILTTLLSVTHQIFTKLLFFADSSFVAIAFITDLSSFKKQKKKKKGKKHYSNLHHTLLFRSTQITPLEAQPHQACVTISNAGAAAQ